MRIGGFQPPPRRNQPGRLEGASGGHRICVLLTTGRCARHPLAVMNLLAWLREARWRVAAFLAFAAALNYADRAAISSVLPALRTSSLTDVQLGLLGSAFLWAYALASPLAGVLADRWSRWKQVVWSLALWSAVTALMGAAHGFVPADPAARRWASWRAFTSRRRRRCSPITTARRRAGGR